MTTIDSSSHVFLRREAPFSFGEDQLAALAFLARYSGRTLEAYRHDLRALFQWAADHDLPVLEATRTHLELYRTSMEERGLAASTIDRRLSTACGFYRFAHIDGRIASNPAQYVRRPTVHPSERRGLDRGELARLLFTAERFDHAHAALAVLLGLNGLRVSEACEHQHRGHGHGARTSGAAHRRQGRQAGPHSLGAAHRPDHRSGHRRAPGRSDPASFLRRSRHPALTPRTSHPSSPAWHAQPARDRAHDLGRPGPVPVADLAEVLAALLDPWQLGTLRRSLASNA